MGVQLLADAVPCSIQFIWVKQQQSAMASGSSGGEFRRKWNRDEYEGIAQDRIKAERLASEQALNQKNLPPVKRDLLKQRDYKVDIDSKLGKSQVITKTT